MPFSDEELNAAAKEAIHLIIAELEKQLKISFDIEEFIGVDTVNKIMKLAQSKVKK